MPILPTSCTTPASRDAFDVSGREAELRGHAGGVVADGAGVVGGVRVAHVERSGEPDGGDDAGVAFDAVAAAADERDEGAGHDGDAADGEERGGRVDVLRWGRWCGEHDDGVEHDGERHDEKACHCR